MVDEVAKLDRNRKSTGIGVTDTNEIRKIRVTEKGEVRVDTKASIIGVDKDELKTQDSQAFLLKEILVELKINNEYLSSIVGDKVSGNDIEITK